jgi:hypothetical protein
MPSIQDVADQINVKLDQINNNTAATVAVGNGIRSDLAQVNTKLNTLDSDLQTGVSVLSNGLFAIWELQKVTNAILDHHSKQNDAIICLLENTNDLLCGMTRKLTHQLDLSEQLVKALKRVEGIAERAEPAAAADFDRNDELEKQILKCCPPDEVKPEPCPEPCHVQPTRPHDPKGQDWHPVPPPRQPVVG